MLSANGLAGRLRGLFGRKEVKKMQRNFLFKKNDSSIKKLIGFLFFILLFIVFLSEGYADSYYNIFLKDGRILKGYHLYKSKKDPSILVAKKQGMRLEIKKVSIDSYRSIQKRKNNYTNTNKLTFKQLLDMPYNSITPLLDSTNKKCMKMLDKHITNSDECAYYDLVYKAYVSKRGIDAEIKLDNGDWSSASDIESLIDSKVRMDMLYQ